MNWLKKNWLWLLINVVAIAPLLSTLMLINLDFSGNGPFLTADMPDGMHRAREAGEFMHQHRSSLWFPIHLTGEWAIRWLTASLTITPLMILFGLRKVRRYRKVFGIYAFVYSLFHLLFFIADRNLIAIFEEFNFILGFVSFIIMIPLALTSNKWSLRKLKKAWTSLHKWAYAAGILAVVHVAFLERGSWAPYAVIILIGLLLRLPLIKNFPGFKWKQSLPQ